MKTDWTVTAEARGIYAYSRPDFSERVKMSGAFSHFAR